MLFYTVLWAAAAWKGGYDANTPCALHCGGHREHCAALTVVTAPTPALLLPREKVTECSSPVADHLALPVQPCSAPRRVKHSGFGAVEINSCPERGQTRTCSSAKVTPTVMTENSTRAVLGAPDDAKRALRRATIHRVSEPNTARNDAFRKSIAMPLVPSERGSPSPRPVV